MNTVTCSICLKPARPTAIGFFCPKCQMWGNMSIEETNLSKTMSDKEWEEYVKSKWENRWINNL